MWLGYEDSNLGMPESESGALPLGDSPSKTSYLTLHGQLEYLKKKVDSRTRTGDIQNHNLAR